MAIKKLDWIKKGNDCYYAEPGLDYEYMAHWDGEQFSLAIMWTMDSEIIPCNSIEQAKEIAEAHWEKLVSNLLT